MGNGNAGGDESPFRGRQEPSAASSLVLIAAAAAVAYGGYRAWSWWQAPQHPAATSNAPFSPVPGPAPTTPGQNRTVITAPAVQSAPDRGGVVKCVAGGVTTYTSSATGCPANSRVSSVAIDPNQNLSNGLAHAPEVIRRPALPAQTSTVQAPPAVDPNVEKKARCLAYDEEIKAIDAQARQPLPAQEQDRLTAKRRDARDQQFRLRC